MYNNSSGYFFYVYGNCCKMVARQFFFKFISNTYLNVLSTLVCITKTFWTLILLVPTTHVHATINIIVKLKRNIDIHSSMMAIRIWSIFEKIKTSVSILQFDLFSSDNNIYLKDREFIHTSSGHMDTFFIFYLRRRCGSRSINCCRPHWRCRRYGRFRRK